MDPKLATFISTLRNPRYLTEDRDASAPIIFTGVLDGKEIEFSASPTDPMSYGRELHRRAICGEMGEIAVYVEPEDKSAPFRAQPKETPFEARMKEKRR